MCRAKGCEHLELLDAYLSIEIYSIDWMRSIIFVFERYNTTNYRKLWGMFTEGKLFPGHPLRSRIKQYHRGVIMPLYHKHGLGGTPGGSPAIKKRWRTDPELKPAHKEFTRLKEEWRESLIYTINFHLDHMTIPEIAYLKMTSVPGELNELDQDLLSPEWHNADDWADENQIFWKAYNEGVLDFTPV